MLIRFLVVLVFLGFCSACGAAARKAAPEAVGASLEAAVQDPNKDKIREIVEETPVKASVIFIDPAVVDTILARLSEPKNEGALRRLVQTISSGIAQGLLAQPSKETQARKDAVIADSARITMRAVLEELRTNLPQLIREVASNPEVRQAIGPVTRTAGSEAVKGAANAVTGGQ